MSIILKSLRGFKKEYLPLLTVYFANGFIVFSQVAQLFWIKDDLSLTQTEVIAITIWGNLPWSMKILFGQFLDSVRILGSHRNVYIYIAATIMLVGNIVMIAVANQYTAITGSVEKHQKFM